MKKLDPRSVIIGFLVAVIGFMSIGATNTTFDSITVGDINIPKRGWINFIDKKGNRIMAVTTSNGSGVIDILNSTGQKTISLSHTIADDGAIDLYNSSGQNTINISHTTAHGGAIGLYNNSGQETISLSHTTTHDGAISLYNSSGQNTALIP